MIEQPKDSESLELLDALEIGLDLSDYEIKSEAVDEASSNS